VIAAADAAVEIAMLTQAGWQPVVAAVDSQAARAVWTGSGSELPAPVFTYHCPLLSDVAFLLAVRRIDPRVVVNWACDSRRAWRLLQCSGVTHKMARLTVPPTVRRGQSGPVSIGRFAGVAALATSKTVARAWKRAGIPDPQVMPPWTPPLERPDAVDARVQLGLPPDARVILALHRPRQKAGVREALWTGAILAHLGWTVRVLVLGGGDAEGALRRFAGELPDPELGRFLPAGALPAALAASDVCLATPRRPLPPHRVLQALGAGKRVVTGRDAQLRELAGRDPNLVQIFWSTPEDPAETTKRLLESPAPPAKCRTPDLPASSETFAGRLLGENAPGALAN